jgi:hypothetical protein
MKLYKGIQVILFLAGITGHISIAQEYTRGIGIYPGSENEYYGPEPVAENNTYRNLALKRAVYHSGSYDYNLTAQLVTDGIIDTVLPGWLVTSSADHGELPKNERYRFLDRHRMTSVTTKGAEGWVQFELAGGNSGVSAGWFLLSGSILINDSPAMGWELNVLGSDDGEKWIRVAGSSGKGYIGDSLPTQWRRWEPLNMRLFSIRIPSRTMVAFKMYRAKYSAPNATEWRITEFELFNEGKQQNVGGPYNFSSAWKSAGNGTEWITLDLGTTCSFDSLSLHWLQPAKSGEVLVSDDAENWTKIASLGNRGTSENISPGRTIAGRYLKLYCTAPRDSGGYILSEIQVFGTGGPIPEAHAPAPYTTGGQLRLSGGNWRIERASEVNSGGEILSLPGYDDSEWMVATVPGTILTSYLNAGAVPDPNFGDNQLMLSDSYFYADFWYRNSFSVPEDFKDKYVFLNFDGINWKADVYLNGRFLGKIEGAFCRGKFDISELLLPGETNILAVRIKKNDTPGYPKEQTWNSPDVNGGEIGGDNPTFHASVGWDWIPTIRGRNTGIWNDVYLTATGPVTIIDPFLTFDLPLPDTSFADLNLDVTLKNHSSVAVSGLLLLKIAGAKVSIPVEIGADSEKRVELNPQTDEAMRISDPELWWPNGYGAPHLYKVKLAFMKDNGEISDALKFHTGIREMSFTEEDGILKIFVNGQRFSGRGGNWGFSESMLRYRKREYDIAVKYHRDMNFTMIRNWVGQTGDEEFYEACDRHGIMVWQDFWLANPVDGPDPYDNTLFLSNAHDYIKRIRNHASMGIYCGRNEGNPPQELDTALRSIVGLLHPGLHYISHSSDGVVSGYGPYRAMLPEYYFQERALPRFHSEMGRPNITSYESLQAMIPDSSLWPQGRMWGLHDFCLNGAQRASSFLAMMDTAFGPVESAREWVELAQFLNYDGYRAMFEAQSRHRAGLFLWMSHPAWPSMVWQTYDYFFEPTAAYFGCKKAGESLHIQWNAFSDSIEVVNYSRHSKYDHIARLELFNLDGSRVITEDMEIRAESDCRTLCFPVPYPENLSEVYLMRLSLLKDDKLISENQYWRGRKEGHLNALRNLPKITPLLVSDTEVTDSTHVLNCTISNPSITPAVMVRARVAGDKSGNRILPALYTDNFLTLLPGEERTLRIEVNSEDTRGETPVVYLDGLNVK